uniref:Plasminogen receptor with a C-terminal lysine n=1 Tax=Strix occidentalis caurina TaxID=311401 RepID=A0A8D0FPF1_STROC
MGFVFSKSMNDSLKAQQEFMVMNSRLQVTHTPAAVCRKVTRGRCLHGAGLAASPLERQLLMQNQMRERQTAMQIAWTREFLKYFGTFFGLAAVGLTAGAIKKKNPGVLLPIVPLSFIFAYQYDMGYGTLLQRIKGEAENILDTHSMLLELPKGPLTYEDLEKIRKSQSKFFTEK